MRRRFGCPFRVHRVGGEPLVGLARESDAVAALLPEARIEAEGLGRRDRAAREILGLRVDDDLEFRRHDCRRDAQRERRVTLEPTTSELGELGRGGFRPPIRGQATEVDVFDEIVGNVDYSAQAEAPEPSPRPLTHCARPTPPRRFRAMSSLRSVARRR